MRRFGERNRRTGSPRKTGHMLHTTVPDFPAVPTNPRFGEHFDWIFWLTDNHARGFGGNEHDGRHAGANPVPTPWSWRQAARAAYTAITNGGIVTGDGMGMAR